MFVRKFKNVKIVEYLIKKILRAAGLLFDWREKFVNAFKGKISLMKSVNIDVICLSWWQWMWCIYKKLTAEYPPGILKQNLLLFTPTQRRIIKTIPPNKYKKDLLILLAQAQAGTTSGILLNEIW